MTEKRQKYIEAHYGSHSVGFPVESAVPSNRHGGWLEVEVSAHQGEWRSAYEKIQEFASKTNVNFEVVGWNDTFHLPPVFELTERGQDMPGAEWNDSTDKSSTQEEFSLLPYRVRVGDVPATVAAFGSPDEAFEFAESLFRKMGEGVSVSVVMVHKPV